MILTSARKIKAVKDDPRLKCHTKMLMGIKILYK